MGDYLQHVLYCLKCGRRSVANELSILATGQLRNPKFDAPYTSRDAPEIRIANGWNEWNTPRTYWVGPIKRFESEPSTFLTHSGTYSQKQHQRYALSRGGVMQKITVTPGKWYRFACWVWVYCSTRDDNVSAGGDLHARVGINPWGAWPDHYASIPGKECDKYDPAEGYDKWVQIEVIAPAFGNEITVFTEALSQHTVSHNDVYWDDASFGEVDLGDAPPPVEPPDPPPVGECGFVDRWQEVLDNQAEILQELMRVPKKGYTVTL